MPKINLEHIVSCSSEDPVHPANNLLDNDSNKKWRCKEVGESSITAIIQLEKALRISGIDIGNENSSFVEVFAGRASSQESDYQILLSMSSFMTPMEARNETNSSRVRLFTNKDLASPARDEKWDRIKIVCTQPFNNHIQFGLSFITLHTPQELTSEENPVTIGKFTLRPESPSFLTAGSLFAKRKELDFEPVTLRQEIRNATTPICKPVTITPSTNTSKTVTESKNRNRKDLFYDSDDDKCSDKIAKVVTKAKEEEVEKRKATEVKTPKNKMSKKKDATPKQSNSTKKVSNKIDSRSNSPSTSKRKIDTTPKATKKKIRLQQTKPFSELLCGVVFTISGIVNPERANLRTKALNMGAKYRPDWDNTCTHLICAYANTPKFQQVQGKGKIVNKKWIPDCHLQRKRLPWRRYALDRNDQGQSESEEETCEKTNNPSEAEQPEDIVSSSSYSPQEEPQVNPEPVATTSYNNESSGEDTEGEIERILTKQTSIAKKYKVDDTDSISTKQTTVTKDPDAFSVDTDEEQLEKCVKDIENEIPKIFKTELFFIDDVFDCDEKSRLERLIKAFNGVVLSRLSNILDFIITNDESIGAIKDRCSSAKFVRPTWIYDCHEQQIYVPFEKYALT